MIAKIRDWEKAARVGEHFAVEVSGAVTGRAELMRDAVELLMAGIERQRGRLETLATVRKRQKTNVRRVGQTSPMVCACAIVVAVVLPWIRRHILVRGHKTGSNKTVWGIK